MKNSLSQRLSDNSTNNNKTNARFNLASFILLRGEIYKAIDDGWSVKSIWEILSKEEKIIFSYQTLLNFVKKYQPNYTNNLKQSDK